METERLREIAEALLRVSPRCEAAGRDQLAGARFVLAGCARALSHDIVVAPAWPALPPGCPTVLGEADGADAEGRRATVTLHSSSGRLTRLEVVPIDAGAGLPLPETLRRLTAVRRGGDVVWLVPELTTILGE